MTDETTKKILSILNPLRVLKVEDWIRISEIIKAERIAIGKLKHDDPLLLWRDSYALGRIATYETITSLPLTKEMFVGQPQAVIEVEEGVEGFEAGKYFTKDDIEEAQSQVLFEGFESISKSEVKILLGANNIPFVVDVYQKETFISFFLQSPIYLRKATISDFITEIDRYNRTATTPITIRVNENFVKNLLK